MAPQSEEPWDLVIGRVAAPFGVKGAVRVKPETDAPERFCELREVALELPSGEERRARVRSARVSPRGVILELAGREDREQAGELRGAWVKIRQSMAIPLPEDSYWVHEIVGLQVVDEEGKDLGEVTEVIRTPGNDVYVTPRVMVPAVREIVKQVDLERGRLVVDLPAEEESTETTDRP
jgi:16S rRNA processing protein RimM